jgi:hypothetical protein
VNNTMSRFSWRELSIVLSTFPVLLVLACGPSPSPALTSADKRVCDDAFQNDEAAIYLDGPGASNGSIKGQAARITVTSSTAVDAAAVQNIVNICKQNGYAKPASPGSTSGTGGTGIASPTPSPSPVPWTPPPANGILECGNFVDNLGISHSGLAMADPATGSIIWTENISPPTLPRWSPIGCARVGAGVTDPDALTQPYDLENFSRDFRRVVAINGPEVGWIDASTGAVTDASQITPPSSAFGAAPTQDIKPFFDPQDNSFWFQRSSAQANPPSVSLMRIPYGGSQAESVRSGSSVFSVGLSNSGAVVDFQALAPGLYSHVSVNPSGSVALDCEPGTGVGRLTQCQVSSPLNSPWKAANVSGSNAQDLVSTWIGRPGDWVSDTQLIGITYAGAVDLATYMPATASISTAALIPNVGNAMPKDFVLSPDGNTVEFIGSDPTGKAFLYRIGLAQPGGQPSQVGPIGDVDLLAWR